MINFFSGFSLEGDIELFDEYLVKSDFTVSGFSYGAIKAFEYALETNERVDLLQLFSPAFFQTQNDKFKRMQLMFFKKDEKSYCENFLKNIAKPTDFDMNKYFRVGTFKELDVLLNFTWDVEKIKKVLNKGIKIEIYLGGRDEIIDSNEAAKFFKEFGTVYFIKDYGHILK